MIDHLIRLFGVVLSVIAVSVLARVLVFDRFTIKGDSMAPTYADGQKVLVNKLLMGARIYTDYHFDQPELHCFRTPGARKIRPGDVAVFNNPYERSGERIEFMINHVFAKRCIGCPGDTISVSNGFYRNSSGQETHIPLISQQMLSSMTDSSLRECGSVYKIYPWAERLGWTIKNMGPLFVPGKGSTILLDTINTMIYGRLIEYECGSMPAVYNGRAWLNGVELSTYTFSSNYYFFAGDNVLNSKDSRYIGLVPEDYIVGIVWP